MATEPGQLQPGDVVQLGPDVREEFRFCFMLVTEPKAWGAQGFVKLPGQGDAYFRAKHDQMHFIGKAEWAPADVLGNEGDNEAPGDA